MQLSDFTFELSHELIARYPLEKRSASRLLCIENRSNLSHHFFYNIVEFLHPGDLLIFNDSKVIPARCFGKKTTGGQVEILIERILDNKRVIAQVRVSKPPKIGDVLLFPEDIQLKINARENQFYELEYLNDSKSILSVFEEIGQIPLPPYMHRLPDENDKVRYQTVYAKHKGSVAAPTAGLHFDNDLLEQLKLKGIEFAYLTLHIGAGTFQPVRVDNIKDHVMHTEFFTITNELCQKIAKTKASGNRVIAVGTTSLRALESASLDGQLKPYQGETNIFIYPGYHFNCVDALITNLHLPGSTLLMLVCAFGGYENVMNAYKVAIEEKYRFYSYGDAMFMPRAV